MYIGVCRTKTTTKPICMVQTNLYRSLLNVCSVWRQYSTNCGMLLRSRLVDTQMEILFIIFSKNIKHFSRKYLWFVFIYAYWMSKYSYENPRKSKNSSSKGILVGFHIWVDGFKTTSIVKQHEYLTSVISSLERKLHCRPQTGGTIAKWHVALYTRLYIYTFVYVWLDYVKHCVIIMRHS